MIRMFVYFALLLGAAFGLALLVETPGSVVLTYGGFEYRFTLAKALAILVAMAVVLMILWWLVRVLLRLPGILAMSRRMRKKSRGYAAVSRGLVSIGVGDRRLASRYAGEAERLLGQEPLALLLKAQSAQLSGDRKVAESTFTRMLDNPETRVLGLRGLFIEARREGNERARGFAEEAYRIAPASPWAGQAVLEYRTAEKDWRGAMAAVDDSASRRVIDRDTARRQKATLLAAEALATTERNPEQAQALAAQALKLNPAHVPAAVIVAERLSAKGDYSKATRTLESAWKQIQHPDIAESYLSVRHGDSTHDRLKRAKALARLTPKSREGGLVLAKAALDAREFDLARQTLEPLVLDQPTARACRLMAELEDRETGNAGMVRKWLSRASRAPRDPAWVADGFVAEAWSPVSPVTGKIDAFVWMTPPQSIESAVRASIDADRVSEHALAEAANAQPALKSSTQEPVEAPVTLEQTGETASAPAADEPVAAEAETAATPAVPETASEVVKATTSTAEATVATVTESTTPDRVLSHLPDDPGPRKPGERSKRGFFG